MRSTRIMTWVLLAFSAAFFFVREFRSALQLVFIDYRFRGVGNDVERYIQASSGLAAPQPKMQALARRGEQNHDAGELAFAALHLKDPKEAFDAADKAVTIDPALTYIGYFLTETNRESSAPEIAPRVDAWLEKLRAFEPTNALPYLTRADVLRARDKSFPKSITRTKDGSFDASAYATHTEWLAVCANAFAQPRYQSAHARLFLLQRRILQQEGWDTQPMFYATIAQVNVNTVGPARDYVNYKMYYLVSKADAEHRPAEAIRQYDETIAFAKKIIDDKASTLDALYGMMFLAIADEGLQAHFQRTGNKEEAAQLKQSFQNGRLSVEVMHRYASHYDNSSKIWASTLYAILTMLIAISGTLSLLAVAYVNLKARFGSRHEGFIYQLATIAENYLPILLFTCCVALYLVNAPYATNFHYYMTVQDPTPILTSTYDNVFPMPDPFQTTYLAVSGTGATTYALAAGALLIVIFVVAAATKAKDRPRSAYAGRG